MCDEWARKFNKRESCVYKKSILDDMCIAYFSGYCDFDMIFIFNNTDQNKIRIYFIFVEYSFQNQTSDTEKIPFIYEISAKMISIFFRILLF